MEAVMRLPDAHEWIVLLFITDGRRHCKAVGLPFSDCPFQRLLDVTIAWFDSGGEFQVRHGVLVSTVDFLERKSL